MKKARVAGSEGLVFSKKIHFAEILRPSDEVLKNDIVLVRLGRPGGLFKPLAGFQLALE